MAVGVEGFSEEVKREVADLKDMARKESALELAELDRDKATAFWKNLADCTLKAEELGQMVVKFKGSFLISRYAEVMQTWTDAAAGRSCALTVSAGLGLAHAYFFDEPDRDLDNLARLGAVFRDVTEQYEGSMVTECAPASLKQKLDPWGNACGDFVLMKRVKENVDPLGVLNPGRFIGGL